MNDKAYIIAEIGINHMGNEDLCKEMILSALDSGADCVKLQTVNEEESYLPNTESYKIFKGTHLNYTSLKRLSNFAKDNNGFLFSTPADFSSLDLLNSIDVCAYKISSGLLTNSPLLDKMSTYNKPIILSTGMANEIEISNAVNLLRKKKVENIALLHCVSLYPASFSTLNLFGNYGSNWGRSVDPTTNQFIGSTYSNSGIGLSSGLTIFNGFSVFS